MLYRFNSAAAGEIVMLAPHAEEIFSAMDRPLEARGVLPASQLPAAIAAGSTADEHDRGAADAPVPFHTRAVPFLTMLNKSQAAQADVTWGI